MKPIFPISLRHLAACVLLTGVVLATSCKRAPDPEPKEDPDTAAVVQPPPSIGGAEPSEAPAKVAGGSLNDYFPKDAGEWDVIFTQEKQGFAQAKLEKDGAELATLSVSDFAGNTKGLAKFENTGMTLGGHPARPQGKNGTLVLAGRFQVSVRSKDAAFTSNDRDSWIQKFDLAGLAAMAK